VATANRQRQTSTVCRHELSPSQFGSYHDKGKPPLAASRFLGKMAANARRSALSRLDGALTAFVARSAPSAQAAASVGPLTAFQELFDLLSQADELAPDGVSSGARPQQVRAFAER
jgi:hypothetical protein